MRRDKIESLPSNSNSRKMVSRRVFIVLYRCETIFKKRGKKEAKETEGKGEGKLTSAGGWAQLGERCAWVREARRAAPPLDSAKPPTTRSQPRDEGCQVKTLRIKGQ